MIKIVAVALVATIIIIYLKNIGSELYILALVTAGVILFSMSLSYLETTFSFINQLINLTGIDIELYKIIFKITAIGYVIEFGAGTIEDMGFKGISDKLVFTGKIIIFSMSLPILYSIINLIVTMLK